MGRLDQHPAYRIELVAGEHQTFADICSYQDSIAALANVPEIVTETIDTFSVEGCSPGDIDDTRANEITTTYLLGFLDQVLHGGGRERSLRLRTRSARRAVRCDAADGWSGR